VGTGGVMLPHYSPLKVAETFSMLSSMFPHRIDLGIGRAPGTSPMVAHALQRDRRQPAPDDFHEQLEELLGYFAHRGQPVGPFRQIPAFSFTSPEPWLLGSSPQSAVWAAELGLPYAFADFINPEGVAHAAYYREHFRPSELLAKPQVAVAVWAICADSQEEALRLSSSGRMMLISLYRARLIPVPQVERAVAFLEQEGVPIGSLPRNRRMITGEPGDVRAAIQSVAAEYGAQEVFVVNIMHSHAARRRSYELIASAFELRATST
jgi:luciferase family oxidoreductase group 1